MSDDAKEPAAEQPAPLKGRITIIELLVVIALITVCLGLALPGGTWLFEIPITLVFGWPKHLWRVVPKLNPDPWVIGTALLCLAGVILGGHLFLRWLTGARGEPGEAPRWPLKRTLQLVGLLVLMFAAGIAMVGMTHQTAWLARSPEPLTSRPPYGRVMSANNLKQIGLSAQVHQENTNPPELPRSRFDATGRPMHSWQTAILPYIEQDNLHKQIDHTKPWTDPANAQPLGTYIQVFDNRYSASIPVNGFGVSHYAGNSAVVLSGRPRTLESFPAGTSNTILAGEVSSNFQAWGDPLNARDPRLGSTGRPHGFGGPGGRPAQFVLLDGSVRTFDPAELEKLVGAVPD